MKSGLMDRALITKFTLREFSQWTAATTLVAAGTLALFSATTLDKLSRNGEVSIDLQAFRKVGSASLALDRLDDQRLIAEEQRLEASVAFSAAESLPVARTAFTKIHLRHMKRKTPQMIGKTASPTPVSRSLAGAPVVLSPGDAEEIAQLERVNARTIENQAIAQVYRNLRFQFIAAVDQDGKKDFASESVAIAETTESFEYDEVPELDERVYALSDGRIETAPAKGATVAVQEANTPRESLDSIPFSSSVELTTANIVTLNAAREVLPPVPVANPSTVHAVMTSPGLDLVPESFPSEMNIHTKESLSIQEKDVERATGPPKEDLSPQIAGTPSLQAQSGLVFDSIPEKNEAKAEPIAKAIPSKPVGSPSDLSEYSKDVASAYQGVVADGDEQSPDYSKGSAEDSIIDGDFSARPSDTIRTTLAVPGRSLEIHGSGSTFTQLSKVKNYGEGVRSDTKGITIDWNEHAAHGEKVFVGKPGATIAAQTENPKDVADSLKKFSFTAPTVASAITVMQSSAVPAEPIVDTKKCETARLGVEAFNSGAEKETLAICRRELSLEGSSEGTQARWWESYENDAEHWPTLSYLRAGEASPANRTPLLSTASIRLLSAISKTNTHTGTGILFGEVAKGLEIQLLGRSDSPIYLEAGMKIRDPGADVTGSRQFVFLNVEPGQPLLIIKNREKNLSGAIPLVVKSGMATNVKVNDPKELDLEFTVFNASSPKESRMANLTAEVIGQPGRLGITDRLGTLKIRKVVVFGDYPVYVDLLRNEKSYKNRFRLRPATIEKGAFPLFFFDEKRVAGWLSQLSGGLSPYSGLIAGIAPASVFGKSKDESRYLKIGILEKKSSLVPERYLLDGRDHLVSESALHPGRSRYIGVQIPEGPAIPTIVDAKGVVRWSELVYSQPGVINVVNPDL